MRWLLARPRVERDLVLREEDGCGDMKRQPRHVATQPWTSRLHAPLRHDAPIAHGCADDGQPVVGGHHPVVTRARDHVEESRLVLGLEAHLRRVWALNVPHGEVAVEGSINFRQTKH